MTASGPRPVRSVGTAPRSTRLASRCPGSSGKSLRPSWPEEATHLVPADVVATATEANRVALLAAQSMPKFRSEAERDLYEEARATRAALELGLAQIRSSLRRLRTEQESVPALLGELVAAVGKLPTAATPVVAPTRGDGRREGEDGEVGVAYGA
ncbi:hypothetical protein GMDG_02685 [Pseudogymnoascus destructans 20631-21]|uniref:Uncharacterized protein n=1 Tax=Pseudogymnoascus destructans (strain ATCC MYA-4855 / 20631-21) TaxID=658429 RepID=L8G3E9_PSED2|nr:hypothetical protein GMDG_02685 [Pseudogymnoascus destructans 20631-21]